MFKVENKDTRAMSLTSIQSIRCQLQTYLHLFQVLTLLTLSKQLLAEKQFDNAIFVLTKLPHLSALRISGTFVRAFPGNIYLFQVNNRSTRKKCKICSKLIIKTPVLVFLQVTLNIFHFFSSISIVDLERVNFSCIVSKAKFFLLIFVILLIFLIS